MSMLKIIALVLVVLGLIILAYGGFTYVKSSQDINLGPVELSVRQKENFYIPVWIGVISAVLGTVLLLVPIRKNK